MVPGLLIAFGILTIWNMIEHAVGSYFLFRRRKEFLLLFLFSIVNFLYAAINFGFFVIKMTNTSVKVYVIYATLFRIPFYWMMMMLTLERFLVVFLHLRYGKFDFFFLLLDVLCTLSEVIFCEKKSFSKNRFPTKLIFTNCRIYDHFAGINFVIA